MNKIERLFNAFGSGIKPQSKIPLVKWCKENVYLAQSQKDKWCDLELTPFFIEPLQSLTDNVTDYICLNAPPGAGKTTAMTAGLVWLISNKPGPSLIGMLSNTAAQELMETVLVPAFEHSELIKPLIPTNKNAKRVNFINFANMPLWVGGANKTNAQSRSCQYVFLDEVWQLDKKQSILKEFERRTHDRFGSKVFLCSQSGVVDDEFDTAINKCEKHAFNYHCKHCNSYYPYDFNNLKWTVDKSESGEYIWNTLNAWYECPCGHKYQDTEHDRRTLCNSGKYLPEENNNPLPNRKAYTFNALAVYWIRWFTLASEFLIANQERKKGNINLLRQFFQKRLSIPFDEKKYMIDATVLNVSDYTLADAKQIRGDETFMTIDVQMDTLFYLIRTWWKNGESKTLAHGNATSMEDARRIQTAWEIKDNRVGIDVAYALRAEEVKEACFEYKWNAMNGRGDSKYYTVVDKATKKKVNRIYDDAKPFKISKGVVGITNFSSNKAKDILFALKSGKGCPYGIPKDISEDYKHQMTSEYQKIDANGEIMYIQAKNRNHLLDCSAQDVVLAIAFKCYQHNLIIEDADN